MPAAAFEETERQWRYLVEAGSPCSRLVLERYVIPEVPREQDPEAIKALGYRDVHDLYRRPPDALIVTGAEPKAATLAGEVYWSALKDLLWWARSEVPAAFLSCLASHAALFAFDDVERRPLSTKRSGAYGQVVDKTEPLMSGVRSVQFVHSRWNDVPSEDLVCRGYRVLAESEGGDWTIALGERDRCSFVLCQGHPEYGPLTLLREYRRDVRRYLSGLRDNYPAIPTGYLDPVGEGLLRDFQAEAEAMGTPQPLDPSVMDRFPFEPASAHVTARWQGASRRLFRNWVTLIRHRCDQQSYSKKRA
jgi:homoserine O-succinyltransferase